MLEEVADFVLSFSKFSYAYREFKELCENKMLFHKKWTYGLGIMKLLVLLPNLGSHKKIIFSVFWVNFFVAYSHVNFQLNCQLSKL